MKRKNYLWGILYGLFLTGFTVYVLLDTFVIARVYRPVTPDSSYSQTEYGQNSPDPVTEQNKEPDEATTGNDSDSAVTTENSDKTDDSSVGNDSDSAVTTENSDKTDDSSVGNDSDSAATTENSDKTDDSSVGNDSDSAVTTENSDKTDDFSAESGSDSAVITENSYQDGNISVAITEYRQNDTTIYAADVRLASAEYLKTAFAKNAYGKNITEKTSAIAENHQAILAINGDYYGAQKNGYVLRNGVLYRSAAARNQEDLVIYQDGSFALISESEVSAEQLREDGAAQILSFGPGLIKDGAVCVSQNDEVGKAKASNPRTAVGIIDELHYVFVVSDGRTEESEGLSLYELAVFMQSLSVRDAYNLDGGGSSTMVFCGEVVNHPTTNGNSIKERSVSDIVYIGYQ